MKPAARLGDMHTCPLVNPGPVPHVGGPILPVCAPTVLTCGQPQARVGDLCTCVGPPDVIAVGAFTVLVSGQPAARLGDQTAHGGVIVMGAPTVLIGDGGASGGAGGGLAVPAVPTVCGELAQAKNDLMLANHTYGEDPALPPGYRQVTDPRELAALGLTQDMLTPPPGEESNFHAEVFARDTPAGPAYTVAFRGTQMTEMADWGSNLRQGVGLPSDHYDRTLGIARRIDQSGANVSYTGHSLGGGMASAAAVASGRSASTFNAAGLSNATVASYPPSSAPVTAWYTPRDPLSAIQDNREGVLAGAAGVAGAINPYAGAATGGYIVGREAGSSPLLPRAYGDRRELPETEGFWSRVNPLNIVEPHGTAALMEAIDAAMVQNGC